MEPAARAAVIVAAPVVGRQRHRRMALVGLVRTGERQAPFSLPWKAAALPIDGLVSSQPKLFRGSADVRREPQALDSMLKLPRLALLGNHKENTDGSVSAPQRQRHVALVQQLQQLSDKQL